MIENSKYVQEADIAAQFWQFLSGLHSDDLLIELIQNDLDANATCTSITFMSDRLICEGDGEPVSQDGWKRLRKILGAGYEVASKKNQIGVKNHGLKACFRLGDQIILRSNGQRIVQTLYKDGEDRHPSPGASEYPELDDKAPPIGCSVEVLYRQNKLVVYKGEPFELETPKPRFLEDLFRDACTQLPQRLLGVVRPSLRDHYTLSLSHYELGEVEFRWLAKRPRKIKGKYGRQFTLFRRECISSSHVPEIPSNTTFEQACAFRVPFPSESRRQIPQFFKLDNKAFVGEIAWSIDKKGRPNVTKGSRRYPIGYESTSESALTGVGVHFSGPYISDAERHGISEPASLNKHIDDYCKDALVEVMACHLIHRYGGKAMKLYMADPHNPDAESLQDLVDRTLKRRALPLRYTASKSSGKRSSLLALGPRSNRDGSIKRVVSPMFTWENDRIDPILSALCPQSEDQIDPTLPQPILNHLKLCSEDSLITFDEKDVIQRLQPRTNIEYFPWEDDEEWRVTLSNLSVANKYLDVVFRTRGKGKLDSEEEIRKNVYLPDKNLKVMPLSRMFNDVQLPTDLGEVQVCIIHPEIQEHPLLKSRAWKPKSFTLDNFLDKARLEDAPLEDRKVFWGWLKDNWQGISRDTLLRIANLPVWPCTDGQLLPLYALCQPRLARISSIMGNVIKRPSPEVLKSGLGRRGNRARLRLRAVPTHDEIAHFLSKRLNAFPRERALTHEERRKFHKFESDLAALASVQKLKRIIADISNQYNVALAKDGNIKAPQVLVREDYRLARLHLSKQYIIDRPKKALDGIDGWKPLSSPTTHQIVCSLIEDGDRVKALVPRLQEYVKQAKFEDTEPVAVLDVRCIPVNGTLSSPSSLAMRGRKDFWGDWKTAIPLAGINSEVQQIYKLVGVVGGEPTESTSREFFEWLSGPLLTGEVNPLATKHIDQILRHIGHKNGPQAWAEEYPATAFIPVEAGIAGVRLLTKAEAFKRNNRVVIPDFEPLAEELRNLEGRRPVELALLRRPRVMQPITQYLRDLGLPTLSEMAGEPISVVGKGRVVTQSQAKDALRSLSSGVKGKQLPKRLDGLDLPMKEHRLRSNWRDRLARIRYVKSANSVSATYKLSRKNFSIEVPSGFDRTSGTLWLYADSDWETAFFNAIAQQVFETPKKFLGSVLRDAFKQDVRESELTVGSVEASESSDDDEEDESSTPPTKKNGLYAVPAAHPIPTADPSRNIPKPSPIPIGPGKIKAKNTTHRNPSSRTQSADESAQIANLKENQYALHCQACLGYREPRMLAPSSSYVSLHQNRRPIMEAHHCDQVEAGGARHAGNVVLLCKFHHLDFGDAVSRLELTQALLQADNQNREFITDDGTSAIVEGKHVLVSLPQRQRAISVFFTKEHADYWLTKAREEGLCDDIVP